MTDRDWRLPQYRREAFQRSYTFSLRHLNFPGMVYSMLPAIADAYDLDNDGRAWLVWLNGNTQNVVTSMLLLEAAPHAGRWRKAVEFWNDRFTDLEWDTDRRHQKSKFGEATEKWAEGPWGATLAAGWYAAGDEFWEKCWHWSKAQPYMGRLSAWSMYEYARILLGPAIPDIGSFMLEDKAGSRSHRNALGLIAGYDAVYWDADTPDVLGVVPQLEQLAEDLLLEAGLRNEGDPNVTRLTMESALCTYKSWHKPNRRYPNVYADMMYNRIRRAEQRFGRRLDLLWDIRRKTLPDYYLRLEDSPFDPGLSPVKQNHYLETGQPIMMSRDFPDLDNSFETAVEFGLFGRRAS